MESLVLPESVTIRLVDKDFLPVNISGFLIKVTAFARYRNNYHLGPFVSDEGGVIKFTRKDLLNDISAVHDSGLMDYAGYESCEQKVRIHAYTDQEIKKEIRSRSDIWVDLLQGEAERWGTIENLIAIYQAATNGKYNAVEVESGWDDAQKEYEFEIVLNT
jgi:hypothetical protein